MKLTGTIGSTVKNAAGHSQVRVSVPGFGEVIFSAPKEALAELMALPDETVLAVSVEHGA